MTDDTKRNAGTLHRNHEKARIAPTRQGRRRMNYNNFDSRLRGVGSPRKTATGDLPESELRVAAQAKPPAFRKIETGRGIPAKRLAAVLAFAGAVCVASAQSYVIDANTPAMDKWVYPFAGNGGGTRASGPTFGAIGTAGFDDRDAQFFARFDTGSLVPSGLGADRYQILSAKFTLSIAIGGAVAFDSTYDPITTYGPAGESINGDDPGRPMELFGAAFRNGVSSATLTETTSFGTPGEGTRNIYATDFLLGASLSGSNRDVSNNVTAGFDPSPFAIGQIAPGDLDGSGLAGADADVVFTLNLANPDVLRYLQLSLNDGQVSFLTTSLHQASQGGPTVYPDFYTKENLLDGLPGRLDIQVQVVPEPVGAVLFMAGLGMVALGRRNRGKSA